jgi:hypothetical protein
MELKWVNGEAEKYVEVVLFTSMCLGERKCIYLMVSECRVVKLGLKIQHQDI